MEARNGHQEDGIVRMRDGMPLTADRLRAKGSNEMTSTLNVNDDLEVIKTLTSPNGSSTFTMQADGNLVLYRANGKARWATGTVGKTVSQAVMQGDGNFVLYAPGSSMVWATGTGGHPGATLVVQDDGNVVIYDPAGRPLWATNTNILSRGVKGFLPSTSGFHFSNANFAAVPDVTISVLGQQIKIGDAANGLCGGMAFAVRDYFEAAKPIPSDETNPTSGPLFDYIVERLFDSFNLLLPPPPAPAPPFVPVTTPIPPFGPGPATYMWLMDPALPDHETVASNNGFAPRGKAWVMVHDTWPRIQSDIDTNVLSPVALVEVVSLDPTKMGHNHQVLAYGYDLDGTDLSIRIYDPNRNDNDQVTMSLSVADPQHTTPVSYSDGSSVLCFFQQVYMHKAPPLIALKPPVNGPIPIKEPINPPVRQPPKPPTKPRKGH
jgi:hypothetical protein